MKQKARLIIPMWGEVYARKLISITIPALLAPGNLPAFAEEFDVEFALVTETKLFDFIRASESFKIVSQYCKPLLIPIDDLMTDLPGDYGIVLTYALFRGFADLGDAMTDTNLLFFNTDFIISDGSLRHVAKLIKQGERVIHAPSFRVVLEDVWPQLEARVDRGTGALAMPAREMTAMALKHKHITVKARTVNQQLCHQWRMDQFYWYVDEHTLIGYQWPVALIAIRPERPIYEPTLVWDFGFIPEAAPTLQKHFIDDSDDFFMLEPQKRSSADGLIRLGAISTDDIAKDLSRWTTKEQRECGQQLLKIHSADLPDIESFVSESRAYIARITSKLTSPPQPHIKHGLLSEWFDGAKIRMRANRIQTRPRAIGAIDATAALEPIKPGGFATLVLATMKKSYKMLFGRFPFLRRQHPLWVDFHAVADKIASWQESKDTRLLWIGSSDAFLYQAVKDRLGSNVRLSSLPNEAMGDKATFDVCFCELSTRDFENYRDYYERIRPVIKNGGEIVAYVFRRGSHSFYVDDLELCETALPDLDIARIHFFGTAKSALFRALFLKATSSLPNRPMARNLLLGLVLMGLAPLVRLISRNSGDDSIFNPSWTSLMVESKVIKQ